MCTILARNHPQLLSGNNFLINLPINMLKKLVFIVLAFVFSINLMAQNPSNEFESGYSTAKLLMQQGKFGLAEQSFKKLLSTDESNALVPYAMYYMAFSAYKAGNISYARDAFLQLTVKYETWSKIDAAYLWLAQIGFEQSGAFKGMLYASKITKGPYLVKSNKLIESAVKHTTIDTLAPLHEEYPTNRIVAEAYATVLSRLPNSPETTDTLNKIIDEFGFDREKFSKIPLSHVKEHYDIGLVLPLFIDRLEATGKYLKKSLAIDIYEGAQMAANDVDSTLFTLHVFDSKTDSLQMERLFMEGGLEKMDVVLGPLYPTPVSQMQRYASEHQSNFVNPTSSNPEISESSPYAFLSRASATDLAILAADYIKTQPVNKNLFIYYGTSEVDSISAHVYKASMEADSFNVISIQRIGSENRRQVYDGLTVSKTVVDRAKLARMSREEIRRAIQLPTTDSLLIQPDSIGHIFIASSDPTLPTEAMSAIISRGDSIKIMGVGNWFEQENAGLSIMEGLGVTLAISAFDDVSSPEYRLLTERYIEKYRKRPGKYFFRGYFAMKFITESLKHYGTYFQNGYRAKGNFDTSMDFADSNDNKAIYIIKMVDNQIQKMEIEEVNDQGNDSSSKY